MRVSLLMGKSVPMISASMTQQGVMQLNNCCTDCLLVVSTSFVLLFYHFDRPFSFKQSEPCDQTQRLITMAMNYKQDEMRSLRFVEFGLSVKVHIQNTVTSVMYLWQLVRSNIHSKCFATNNGIICFHTI
jgi:hypothetical protein